MNPDSEPLGSAQDGKAKSQLIRKILTILKKQHYDYHEVSYIFRKVRAALGLKRERKPYKLPVLLTEEELKALYQAISREDDLKKELMLKLLFYTGVRNEELTNIKVSDVYLTERKILIRQGKGSKDRYVLFKGSFELALKAYIKTNARNIYLFESQRCGKYSTRRIQQIVKEFAEKAGIKKRVYPHLLRHQLFTYLINRGLTRDEIKLISGHGNLKNLEIYTQLSLENVQRKYEQAMERVEI
jgi:site-specific recombinase XerD